MAEVGAAFITPVFTGLAKGVWAKPINSWSKPNPMTAFLRSGTNTTAVAHLAACLSGLIPLKEYDDALKLDAVLHGTHNSTFLSNMMGPLVPTTTVELVKQRESRPLVLVVTTLRCLWPTERVQGLLTMVLSQILKVDGAAMVARGEVRTTTHFRFLELHQSSVQAESSWFRTAFSDYVKSTHRAASHREIVLLLAAVQSVQQENATSNHDPSSVSNGTYIRVRNIRRMEDICAVLVLFGAKITIGDKRPRFKSIDNGRPRYTAINFSYDDGDPSVDIIQRGCNPREYVIPAWSPTPRLGRTLLAFQIKEEALTRLSRTVMTPQALLLMASFTAFGQDPDFDVLKENTSKYAMMKSWLEKVLSVLRSIHPGSNTGGPSTPYDLLDLSTTSSTSTSTPTASTSPTSRNGINSTSTSDRHVSATVPTFLDLLTLRKKIGTWDSDAFCRGVKDEYGLRDDLDAEIREHSSNEELCQALQNISVLALLQALCEGDILSLELDLYVVQAFFKRSPQLWSSDPTLILDVIPAFRSRGRKGTNTHNIRWCFAVQSGTNVICPSVLAQEKMGTAASPLFTVLHGSMEKDRAPVTCFYPDLSPKAEDPFDVRDTPLPADASDTNTFEYFYTRDEEGEYYYSVWGAGHPLRLERCFLPNLLQVHHYSSHQAVNGRNSATKHWDKLAPHHSYYEESGTQENNRIFLAYKNDAGRLLALSHCKTDGGIVFCPDNEDYLGAWGYAENSGYHALIL